MMIDVVLVDGQRLVRQGVRCILESAGGIHVVAEFERGEDVLRYARLSRPDVVVLDLKISGIGGLETIRRLRAIDERIGVVVLTAHSDQPYPARSLAAGACGFAHKGCDSREITEAIRKAHTGCRYLSREVANGMALASVSQDVTANPFMALTQREFQVVSGIFEGYTPKQIARWLGVSPKTVSTYRSRIYDKLGVSTETQLARMAIRHSIIDEEISE